MSAEVATRDANVIMADCVLVGARLKLDTERLKTPGRMNGEDELNAVTERIRLDRLLLDGYLSELFGAMAWDNPDLLA